MNVWTCGMGHGDKAHVAGCDVRGAFWFLGPPGTPSGAPSPHWLYTLLVVDRWAPGHTAMPDHCSECKVTVPNNREQTTPFSQRLAQYLCVASLPGSVLCWPTSLHSQILANCGLGDCTSEGRVQAPATLQLPAALE